MAMMATATHSLKSRCQNRCFQSHLEGQISGKASDIIYSAWRFQDSSCNMPFDTSKWRIQIHEQSWIWPYFILHFWPINLLWRIYLGYQLQPKTVSRSGSLGPATCRRDLWPCGDCWWSPRPENVALRPASITQMFHDNPLYSIIIYNIL